MNRLGASTSPYLLQHKDNPVDWWPWCDEAFAEARRRDVPILLSVGYAACHWCHVMAHESFEDPGTAAVMNANYVCIKVDREERPDIDAVYMRATQAMTGQGGWPMTVFATPVGEPFFCGTYFPPRPQAGMPGFRQLLDAVADAWANRRQEILESAATITAELAGSAPAAGDADIDLAAVTDRAVSVLRQQFDAAAGGFSPAPKFPPSMTLEFLLRHASRTGSQAAADMAAVTLTAMARGGIYDQLAGGFARYSVDSTWTVPHFEKMLYDNAQLLDVYTTWWRDTGNPLANRIVREAAEFLLRDLRTEQGGFASSLDADTAGVEGATYVWTRQQLCQVLGGDDGEWAAALFSVGDTGSFGDAASVLTLRTDPDEKRRYAGVRARLLAARRTRPQPDRDDKVVTAWNGMAIGALARAGSLLDEPEWVAAASDAARLCLELHRSGEQMVRTSRDGRAGSAAGLLEDHGALASGLLALHQASGQPDWLAAAGGLLDAAVRRFAAENGGFYDTAADSDRLLIRPRDPLDSATPAGSGTLAAALLGYGALTGSVDDLSRARTIVAAAAPVLGRYPLAAGSAAATAEALLAGPLQIAVVGAPEARRALERAARLASSPGAVVVAGEPDAPGIPLLAGRPLLAGAPAAYVCREFVCDAPVSDVEALLAVLARPSAPG